MSWQTLLAIGSGGFFGAICRAYFNGLVNENFPHALPLGTLGVNIIGSFLLGLILASFAHFQGISPEVKSLISTGFLGAFTTYSTFATETFLLFQGGSWSLGFANATLNVVGTIIAAGSGYKLINFFLG
jgi:CrcB protein